MSIRLQLGLLHLQGRSASRADRESILGEFGGQSFEIAGEVADGPVLLAYRANRITLEEETEVQPFLQGPYALTWDGRLDNREELARRVGLRYLEQAPDPVIVLKAFEALGERVFSDVIGEFALTLWSSTHRSLLFARSSCGARPLYYVLNDDRLMWSSNFAHLVRVSGVELDINDEYLLQHLVTTPDVKQTPLAKVKAIPPNRIVHFTKGQIQHGSELWNPIHLPVLQYRTDAEYEEHCREKITEAVRVRLRSRYPVFAELSGGLDSSTVVLTADKILRSRNSSPLNLHTVSCVYEESKSADERGFIRAVEDRRGVETHLIHEDDQRITLGLDDPPFTGLPHTLHCFPGRYEFISSLMQLNKARVLLTGRGGDHLFWSAPDGSPIVADELYGMHMIGAHRECCTWSRVAGVPYYELLINRALRLSLGSVFPNKYFVEEPQFPIWVHPSHRATLLSLTADFQGFTSWRTSPGKRAQVFVIDRMFRMLGTGFGQDYPRIYISHPYSHRPLIEFCLSAPISQFLRNGQTRSLMRRALHDLLPRKTATRVSKGLVDETVVRALRREHDRLSDLQKWQVCRRGYVLASHLEKELRQARLGIPDMTGPLARLFSLEHWLRSLSRIRPTTASTRASAVAPSRTKLLLKFPSRAATELRNGNY